MMDQLSELWKIAPVVALLVLVLWAGHKGFWFWSAGVRVIIRQLEHERNEWRSLAITLLRKDGVDLADEMKTSVESLIDRKKEGEK